jgi:hypothetical protein
MIAAQARSANSAPCSRVRRCWSVTKTNSKAKTRPNTKPNALRDPSILVDDILQDAKDDESLSGRWKHVIAAA